LEYHAWNTKLPKLTFFFTKPRTCPRLCSFFMSNEINSFQILYRHLVYLSFHLWKCEEFLKIQCGSYPIYGHNFFNFSFFETLYIAIRYMFLVTFHCFYTLMPKQYVVYKSRNILFIYILSQSLHHFPLKGDKVIIFFPKLARNP
jgi:hypothetical protein